MVRGVIRDQDSFLRYLLFLLGDLDEELLGPGGIVGLPWADGDGAFRLEELPLLEELTEAFCRDPRRLGEVRDLLRDLREMSDDGDEQVVPPGFLELWETFERALRAEREAEIVDDPGQAPWSPG